MDARRLFLGGAFGLAALAVGMLLGSTLPALAAPTGVVLAAPAADGFTYQGRLTNAVGQPVANGTYSITLTAYETATGGTPIATFASPATQVINGLFTIVATGFAGIFDGRDVYIGVTVGNDPELAPRQRVTPVPYAFSLRPSAVISGEAPGFGNAILTIRNNTLVTEPGNSLYASAVHGTAISGIADGTGAPGSGFRIDTGSGVYGFSNSLNYTRTAGVEGYGINTTGVRAVSFATPAQQPGAAGLLAIGGSPGSQSIAIRAAGSGRIQSTASSTIWANGMSAVSELPDDMTMYVNSAELGGIFIRPTTVGALHYIQIPIDLPGQLYGQNTTVKSVKVFYRSSSSSTFIDSTYVLNTADTFTSNIMLFDGTNRNATTDSSYTLTPATPPSLSNTVGGVTIRLGLSYPTVGFGSEYIKLGGIAIELGHE
ncbi:MAG: hypothetical protein KatS3mg060_1957 [Dehalococcoidia bacterium]|nr:MAG: hypothetical protein KatS3mg060_1957 [Dehalococcoidia bacterium]